MKKFYLKFGKHKIDITNDLEADCSTHTGRLIKLLQTMLVDTEEEDEEGSSAIGCVFSSSMWEDDDTFPKITRWLFTLDNDKDSGFSCFGGWLDRTYLSFGGHRIDITKDLKKDFVSVSVPVDEGIEALANPKIRGKKVRKWTLKDLIRDMEIVMEDKETDSFSAFPIFTANKTTEYRDGTIETIFFYNPDFSQLN